MARLPRYVILGQPQPITQRGNNRQVIFTADADYQFFVTVYSPLDKMPIILDALLRF